MHVKRLVWGGVGFAVALLLIAGVLVVWQLDAIIHDTVEREGTAQLDLTTELSDADLELFGGALALDELAIANPDGYRSPALFQLGRAEVGVDYGDLLADPVRIGRVRLESPQLTIERGVGGVSRLNIEELLEQLDTSPQEGEGDPTQLVIERLEVRDAQVTVWPNLPGLQERYTLTVPSLDLERIGSADGAENGAEIGRVLVEVIVALAGEAAASDALPAEARAALAGDLRAAIDQFSAKLDAHVQRELREGLERLERELGGQLGRDAAERAREVGEGLRDETKRAADRARRAAERLLGGEGAGEQEPREDAREPAPERR